MNFDSISNFSFCHSANGKFLGLNKHLYELNIVLLNFYKELYSFYGLFLNKDSIQLLISSIYNGSDLLNDNFLLSQCINLANSHGFELVGCTMNNEEVLNQGHRVYINYNLYKLLIFITRDLIFLEFMFLKNDLIFNNNSINYLVLYHLSYVLDSLVTVYEKEKSFIEFFFFLDLSMLVESQNIIQNMISHLKLSCYYLDHEDSNLKILVFRSGCIPFYYEFFREILGITLVQI